MSAMMHGTNGVFIKNSFEVKKGANTGNQIIAEIFGVSE